MTGPMGIWQHALGAEPDPTYGCCADDVSRALLVDLAHAEQTGWEVVDASAWRSLRFLGEAFDPAERQFRNYRGVDGGWARSEPSQDCQGRVFSALGVALGVQMDPHFAIRARGTFAAALPGALALTALRAVSSTLLGCAAALESQVLDDGLRHATEQTLTTLAARLGQAFAAIPGPTTDEWPWPEPVLTYENGLLPRALIVAGTRLGDSAMVRLGLRTLDWLILSQTTGDGRFSPIGSDGWWPWDGKRSRFDQQPIEATTQILACEAAIAVSREPRYRVAAERAYGWFLGDNEVGVPVAIPAFGSCHDGLGPRGVNRNQGAESTLMWLTAVERMRALRGKRRRTTAPRPEAASPRALAVPAGRG